MIGGVSAEEARAGRVTEHIKTTIEANTTDRRTNDCMTVSSRERGRQRTFLVRCAFRSNVRK
jgi:hypothetical protein